MLEFSSNMGFKLIAPNEEEAEAQLLAHIRNRGRHTNDVDIRAYRQHDTTYTDGTNTFSADDLYPLYVAACPNYERTFKTFLAIHYTQAHDISCVYEFFVDVMEVT